MPGSKPSELQAASHSSPALLLPQLTPILHVQGLVYDSPTAAPELVSPREWLCKAKGCCKPCAPNNAQEASCTKFIDYGMLEFRPTGGHRADAIKPYMY
jgi:hypothetical protein